MRGFLEWLGGTEGSRALLESQYAWPLIESAHVMGVALFLGTVIVGDLRLAGIGFTSIRPDEVLRRMRPFVLSGFGVMVLTGVLIFYSNPVRYYHDLFFRAKMGLIFVAVLNAFLFHRAARLGNRGGVRPGIAVSAWGAAAVSLTVWALVVVAGRLIAYNWFACDIQPQPGWVNKLAGCPVTAAASP